MALTDIKTAIEIWRFSRDEIIPKAVPFVVQTGRWFWSLDTRIAEMAIGWLLIVRGAIWLSPYGDMSSHIYDPLTNIMGVTYWGALSMACGFLQWAGVVINGRWHRSPFLRRGVLLISLMLYTVLAVSLARSAGAGAALQAVMQQASYAAFCFWCIVNITAKGRSDHD
ncbi:MAG: hypothetical protein JJ926_03745 [Roseitalea sp.]|nr:hypothetical protein [Roseitalea sp.]MBO6950969.1 hypothetical protein [Rhizobiaceae bacterium]MBO6591044.1 hypothetical protein [Roseitalea sp.]MBO6599698.1 hypothetical protein [Roseitalea sp.]MBO6611454.1 hypothetical protein [Roseitalea sp.]